jgi:nitroreductase
LPSAAVGSLIGRMPVGIDPAPNRKALKTMVLIRNGRTADHDVQPQFLDRWSPRAFTGEAMPDETLLTIFEAARWAPSCFNAQPWRFCYARRDTPHWQRFMDLLIPGNQVWAAKAAVLGVAVSRTLMEVPGHEPRPAYSNSYDTGAAWMSLALQAHALGWAAHGMMGFDVEKAAKDLRVPANHRVEAAFAIGRQAAADTLPEKLAAREVPSGRQPVESLILEGGFPEG